jgi:ABC-type iron transport system FetAB permease component
LSQLMAAFLILVATIGITFSVQARFAERAAIDRPVRLLLAAFSLLVLLHPSEQVAALACLPVGLIIGYWLLRRRLLAHLEGDAPAAQAASAGKTGRP